MVSSRGLGDVYKRQPGCVDINRGRIGVVDPRPARAIEQQARLPTSYIENGAGVVGACRVAGVRDRITDDNAHPDRAEMNTKTAVVDSLRAVRLNNASVLSE